MQDPVQLAIDHHRAGRLAEAEAIYRQLLARAPRDPKLLHLLGMLQTQRGNLGEAVTLLRASAGIANGAPQVFLALAQALRLSGNFADAESAARRSITLRPQTPAAHNELGLALVHQGKQAPAIAAWREAVRHRPDYAEAWSNLGASLAEGGQHAEAVDALRKAVHFNPNHAPAQNNLANALNELDLTDEAIPHWQRALQLNPDFYDVMINLGKTIHQRGEYADALALFERAIAIKPDDPHARFLRGLIHLVHGRLRQGFIDYEYRFASPHFNLDARTFPQPRWDGGNVAGKTILLHAEQGLGDTIQFARYAPLLAERGAKVIIESPAELLRLLATVPNVSRVIARGEVLPHFDLHASLVSLPMLFGTTLETIPTQVPYVFAAKTQSTRGSKRVGLVWSGNPKHSNDRRRSIRLTELAPLFDLRDVTFVSLQKGPAADQLKGLQADIVNRANNLLDFADSAALINELDVVITVDTSVAHLAGALGARVWVLLPYVPDWRWLLDRTDCPWYPSARLFRQPAPGDWASVVAEVKRELQKLTTSRS